MKGTIAWILLSVFSAGVASATTSLLPGGDIGLDGGWDNLQPGSGNPGTVAVDGILAGSTFGYGANATVNHSEGMISTTVGTGFNMNGGGNWNMSGGKILARYVLSNGADTTFNVSGGTIELRDDVGTQHMGTANGGTLNISGSVMLDGTYATIGIETGGTINFNPDWTGSWTWGTYSGDDWRNLFASDPDMKVDGTTIDAATFDALFITSDGGKTLEMGASTTVDHPVPSDGASDVSISTPLDWSAPTAYQPTSYELFFGTNLDAYANSGIPVATNHYDLPMDLDWSTTYYWVVDALDGTTNHPGTPWSFTSEPDPTALYEPFNDLAAHNVVWDSPSLDSAGSMPLGNGDLGINVWAEPDGDLLLLISKTDAWSDNGRLLKLGRLRISMNPNPFASGLPFVQTLNLQNGEILITAGSAGDEVNLRIWSDANHPAIYIEAEGDSLRDWQADVELWRTAQRNFVDSDELRSAYGVRYDPTAPVIEPDTVVGGLTDKMTWYHRNIRSPWPDTLSVQALSHLDGPMTDPILNRTFGATLQAEGFSNATSTRLVSDAPRTGAQFILVALTEVTPTAADWLAALDAEVAAAESTPLVQRYAEHADWWKAFWERHWMVVTDAGDSIVPGSDAYCVTQGYLLQRFMQACAGRGGAPIKFNGSIFTVDATSAYDADYRNWGPCYWWQNTRLPYWTMPMSGDFDLMEPLFKMYMDALPLARERVQTYYGHAGAYFPETMYFWGTWNNDNYGWDRTGKTDGVSDNLYIRWEWQSGIELLWMMLARYNAVPDTAFATNTLVPIAGDIIDLYDLRFPRDPDGTIRFTPAQALETYWEDSQNPAPEISGLNRVLAGLLELPESLTTAAQRSQWTRLLGELPPLPMREMSGQTAIAPAETLGPKRNTESPELYPVFPYGQYHVGKPDLSLADWTYQTRVNKTSNGWSQDAIFAAMLGRTAEAKNEVVRRFKTKHSGSRFPAFWGPNYDWIPDQCHGGASMIALQKMVLQEDGDRILLFPAWPADWNLKFRFRAKGNTMIEGELRDGQISNFNITPRERYDDVETFIGTVPPQLTGWEDWRRNTPGVGSGIDGDGDGDGFVDLAEYALGGDPDDPVTPEGMKINTSATNIDLAYARPAGLPDILYSLEKSHSLVSADWLPFSTVPIVEDHGDGTETVTYEQLLGAWTAAFYRFQIILQPE